MATYYARKAGNINASDVWATTPGGTAGAQTFVAGDVLVANSFTVTVNVSTNLGSTGEVRNDTTGGASAGGSFSLSNGVTLTANVFAGNAGACVTLASTASAAIVGNIAGGTGGSSSFGTSMASTGTLTVTGSVTGGSGSSAHGINISNTGTLNITGNLIGSPVANTGALNVAAGLNITVVGNVTAGNGGYGITMSGPAVITITGTVTGGAVQGFGGFVGNYTATIIGTAVGGTGGNGTGAFHGTAGTLTVTRAKGGPTATSPSGVSAAATSGACSIEEIEFGDLGAAPTSGPIRLSDKATNVAVFYRFGTTKKTLVDANASGLMPAESNVRSGVVYNGGNSTGTCAVPAASSVVSGAPVDATTGTAALTAAAMWDYLTSAAATSGSMGERLKNCATVASVGQSLADALTP